MTMRASGAELRTAVIASIPLSFGMRTSMRTMSGELAAAGAAAVAPSPASPTIWMSDSTLSSIVRPRRNSSWSSTTRTLIAGRGAEDPEGGRDCVDGRGTAEEGIDTPGEWHDLTSPYGTSRQLGTPQDVGPCGPSVSPLLVTSSAITP